MNRLFYFLLLFLLVTFVQCDKFPVTNSPFEFDLNSNISSQKISKIIVNQNMSGEVLLEWNNIESALEYIIYRSDSTNDSSFYAIGRVFQNFYRNLPQLSYIDNDILPGNTYYYKIRSQLKTGSFSDFSKTVDINIKSPKLSVCRNELIISNNDVIHFGKIAIGDEISIDFTIENIGEDELMLINTPPVEQTSDIDDSFVIIQPETIEIYSNENSPFSITFKPTSEGFKKATVFIKTNDILKNNFSFEITGETYWDKKIDRTNSVDEVNNILIDSKNDTYVISNVYTEISETDWLIQKFDNSGDLLWEKQIDNGADEVVYSSLLDKENNLFVCGTGYNLKDFDSKRDIWIKKFRSNGTEDFRWDLKIDANLSQDIPSDIGFDSTGNLFLAGYSTKDDIYNGWYIKNFNKNGIELQDDWGVFDTTDDIKMKLIPQSMTIDKENNIYVLANGNNLLNLNSGLDSYIRKFNSKGIENTTDWNKTIDFNYKDNFYYKIKFIDNIGIGLCGYKTENDNKLGFVSFYNDDGTEKTVWNTNFSNSFNLMDNSNSDEIDLDITDDGLQSLDALRENNGSIIYNLHQDKNSNLYICGIVDGNWLIKKFDKTGNEIIENWNKVFDGNNKEDIATTIAIDNNGNIFVAGFGTNLVSNESLKDIWIKSFNYNY